MGSVLSGMAVLAAIAMGSNVGDRGAHLSAAGSALGALPGTRVVAVSGSIETPAWGPVAQGPYLNAAATVSTELPARELLAGLMAIERSRGRDRSREQRWGPRTLDLDLILFGDAVIDEPGLVVPHPRMHERGFVLGPLAQIAPDMRHPVLAASVGELLARLNAASPGFNA